MSYGDNWLWSSKQIQSLFKLVPWLFLWCYGSICVDICVTVCIHVSGSMCVCLCVFTCVMNPQKVAANTAEMTPPSSLQQQNEGQMMILWTCSVRVLLTLVQYRRRKNVASDYCPRNLSAIAVMTVSTRGRRRIWWGRFRRLYIIEALLMAVKFPLCGQF